jgi:hypothetical protein
MIGKPKASNTTNINKTKLKTKENQYDNALVE